MLAACAAESVPLSAHENWRWQTPIRELKKVLHSGVIGPVFRARMDYCNSFPVFDNQPFLKTLEEFILADMGSHIFDVARFLFGEAARLYCQTHQITPGIMGEDAASAMLRMQSGATVTVNLSYASRVEHDRFPETFIHVEGELGSAELAPDYWLRITTGRGFETRRCPPLAYAWADPRYALVHSSIVACQRDLLNALQSNTAPETSAADNLKTLKLAQAAYDSTRGNCAVEIFCLTNYELRTNENHHSRRGRRQNGLPSDRQLSQDPLQGSLSRSLAEGTGELGAEREGVPRFLRHLLRRRLQDQQARQAGAVQGRLAEDF